MSTQRSVLKWLMAVVLVVVLTNPVWAIDIPTADPPVGTWDEDNRIYTLTADVFEQINIVDDNLTLDGDLHTVSVGSSQDGVVVANRTGVTIRKLNVSVCRDGISLYYSSDNTLINNTASGNTRRGISLDNSHHTMVTDNLVTSNKRGIFLQNSEINTVSSNNVFNNLTGIFSSIGSQHNTIWGNNTSYNTDGIDFANTSNDNILADNYVKGNTNYGISIRKSTQNTVSGNQTLENGVGICLWKFANDNTLTCNDIANNLQYGVLVGLVNEEPCDDNRIYNNNFIENSIQASVAYGNKNLFNLAEPVGGNHWSDWTSPDIDPMDGFVDAPYVFGGGKDNLPWAAPDGWTPAELIQQLILMVKDLNLKQGMNNSLDSKLQNALAALEAANAGQRQDAVNKMQAFINSVEAQRGKEILEANADALINFAQKVIDLLTAE